MLAVPRAHVQPQATAVAPGVLGVRVGIELVDDRGLGSTLGAREGLVAGALESGRPAAQLVAATGHCGFVLGRGATEGRVVVDGSPAHDVLGPTVEIVEPGTARASRPSPHSVHWNSS